MTAKKAKKRTPFLVTGFPRSGTAFVSALLRASGFDAPHEAVGKDGAVSWLHAATGRVSWAGEIKAREFGPAVHLVRDPLKVIASATTLREESFEYIEKHLGAPDGGGLLRRIMHAWLGWNALVEKQAAARFRVEEIGDNWPGLLKALGMDPKTPMGEIPHEPAGINSRPHVDLEWADLHHADPELCARVGAKAKEYGYRVRRIEIPAQAQRICVCMMVGDGEEENLERCLPSVAPVADDIVVVYTGTGKDRAVEICEEHGAAVFEHPWEDDFALHRNQSIAHAPKGTDWLLFIDADEELFMEYPLHFRRWLAGLPAEQNGVALTMLDMQGGREAQRFNPAKVFRAGKVRYKYAAHNMAEFGNASAYHYPFARYRHYGYDLPPEQMAEKHARTVRLLRKRLDRDPSDRQVHFYLSQIWAAQGNAEAALKAAEKYLSHKQALAGEFNPSVYYTAVQCAMALDMPERAERWLTEAVRCLPTDLDIAYAQFEYGLWRKRPDIMDAGAARYVQLRDVYLSEPTAMQGRFCYTLNEKDHARVLYNLSMLRLNEGRIYLDRLRGVLAEGGEGAEELRAEVEAELDKIGISFHSSKAIRKR